MTDRQRRVIDEFRAHGGRVGGPFTGLDLLLLTTGPRTTALTYRLDEPGRYVVVATAAGAGWVRSLLAEPAVTLEVGGETFAATGRVEAGEQRERLYAAFTAGHPQAYAYAARRRRDLPVVSFSRH